MLLPVLTISAIAQGDFQAPAVLSTKEGRTINAYILATTKTDIRYKTSSVSTDFTDAKLRDFQTVFVLPPSEYQEAMDLYEAGKFEVAEAKFKALVETFKPIANLDNNYSTLSAYYAMECMRKRGDFEALSAALNDFQKGPITRDHQLRQLDLYVMWDAVRTESWDRLLKLAEQRDDEKLPGYQRAQVAYCKALALEKAERSDDAILEYNIAMTADSAGSTQIAQKSAIAVLQIYLAMPEVQVAMKEWGTEAENKKSAGSGTLQEAVSLAELYESFIKKDTPLPENLKKFLDYKAS